MVVLISGFGGIYYFSIISSFSSKLHFSFHGYSM